MGWRGGVRPPRWSRFGQNMYPGFSGTRDLLIEKSIRTHGVINSAPNLLADVGFPASRASLSFVSCPPVTSPLSSLATLPHTKERDIDILTAFYCNARSLRNNLTELHDLLYSKRFKLLCFTESWLSGGEFNDGVLDPQSKFNIYRWDRKARWPGGGVCIFINKELNSCLNEIDRTAFPQAEVISVKIFFGVAVQITVICAYIPLQIINEIVL